MQVVIDGRVFVPERRLKYMSGTLGHRLRGLRSDCRVSMDSVARATGLSKTYIHELETDKATEPGLSVILKLLRYYGVSFEYLFSNLEAD